MSLIMTSTLLSLGTWRHSVVSTFVVVVVAIVVVVVVFVVRCPDLFFSWRVLRTGPTSVLLTKTRFSVTSCDSLEACYIYIHAETHPPTHTHAHTPTYTHIQRCWDCLVFALSAGHLPCVSSILSPSHSHPHTETHTRIQRSKNISWHNAGAYFGLVFCCCFDLFLTHDPHTLFSGRWR